jgi:hypothetical protein
LVSAFYQTSGPWQEERRARKRSQNEILIAKTILIGEGLRMASDRDLRQLIVRGELEKDGEKMSKRKKSVKEILAKR